MFELQCSSSGFGFRLKQGPFAHGLAQRHSPISGSYGVEYNFLAWRKPSSCRRHTSKGHFEVRKGQVIFAYVRLFWHALQTVVYYVYVVIMLAKKPITIEPARHML